MNDEELKAHIRTYLKGHTVWDLMDVIFWVTDEDPDWTREHENWCIANI